MKQLIVVGAVALLAACQGEITGSGSGSGSGPGSGKGPGGGPGDPGTDPGRISAGVECQVLNPGEAPIRRLSNAEYRNTVSDLLNEPALAEQVSAKFVSETASLGFRNNAKFLQINTVVAQQYMDAAEAVAKAAAAKPATLPCTPAAGQEKACASQFIREFGKKAYRRPLTPEEITKYESAYDNAKMKYSFQTAIEWTLFTFLQSPHFLNRVEFGRPPEAGRTFTRPTDHEMASRLSYLLWQSMPDQELFDAADQGQLGTDAEIAVHAERMLKDPRAKRVYQFFDEWLDVDEVPGMQRDKAVFPSFTDTLPDLLAGEAKAFIENVLWDPAGTGSFDTLMTAPYSFLNPELAKHYGVTAPAGTGFTKVAMPGRAGLLTLGGVITVHDKATRTSIVKRGLRVRTDFLCQTINSPPPDVVTDLPEVADGLSQRQKLEQHRSDPVCAQCHDRMDPIGLVFETFDATGRSRINDEAGNPIDTNSLLTHTRDADGAVKDAAELAQRLSQSQEVRDCFAMQTFRFFYGRAETKADACSIKQLGAAFTKSNYSIPQLLVALAKTDAFLYRPNSTTGQP